ELTLLKNLEFVISSDIEDKVLKEYQKDEIATWKNTPDGQGKSTLAYFATHNQSATEMNLNLT
ncbi:MAG: hypothetical protein LBS71_00195, partial [Puniceicoccales bacterium]|nr:hypothetical protein [Puniceicoccales bacterium]